VSLEDRVRNHFDGDAARFDAIYDERKGPLGHFIDDVWRGVVRRRFDLTLRALGALEGLTVLDVGCGSGRYCLAYAARGARRVVGVDLAERMIALARAHAARAGLAERCDFRVGAFPDAVPEATFGAATAMGFFDYVENPAALIAQIREKTTGVVVMSFPKSWEWRAPIRRLRFWLMRCPLFLYSEAEVRSILAAAGVTDYDWHVLDRDYIVVARVRREA
jgi:2-polyprenyl-3-methyl-5-hydroxy-6-metoxy-1,4-benzoquinol methylase